MFVGILILFFVLYVASNTMKQKIYFQPSIDVSKYPDDVPYVMIDDQIHAWYIQGTSSKTILYCHGNAGNIGGRLGTLYKGVDQGYSVLMFDYPGYGFSKGYPTESTFYESGERCMNYLIKNDVDVKNIVLYGESIGCSVAAYLTTKFDVRKTVLQSGVSSIRDVAAHYIPSWMDWVLPMFPEFNTHECLKSYTGDLMVIHSRNDEIIPFSNAEKLSDYTTNLYEIDGTHNVPLINMKKVVDFIEA